ncbi:MAG: N-acetylmuramoyl-L-alanine amidase family 2 [Firmicutes bacterium]|nr:N-acetylmuramoyl-L-alanine amidase family 2 [Bacillota bacterium]
MKRRQFLLKSFGVCSTLWLGQNLLSSCSALAASQAPAITYISKGSTVMTNDNQTYFSIEFYISAQCEIIEQQSTQQIDFILKNTKVGPLAGNIPCNNQFVKRLEIKQITKQDCRLSFRLNDNNPYSELRYALIPRLLSLGAYRLKVDIGTFSSPTAIKEADLAIKETNLTFGPLDTREATTLFVIHHIGLTNDEVTAAEVHRWHLANGWSGIGYHYVIHKDGSIERGRPREAVGAHTQHYNAQSIGINLIGNFEDATPTTPQLESAAKLIAALCHIYNLSPDDSTLLGHRDLNLTLCPGKSLYELLPVIREQTLAYWQR